jgi:cytochrome c
MKKHIIIIGLSLGLSTFFVACGGGASKSTSPTDSTAAANQTAVTSETSAAQDTAASHNGTEKTGGMSNAPGAQLIAKYDCSTCHKDHEKLIGPAFADIAKKYTASDAVIDTLANKVIKGGKGNWGEIPMTPHPTLPVEDAKSMVKYILTVK